MAIIAGAVLVAVLIRHFLVQPFYIPSESMEHTLEVQDRVLVNKLSYRLHGVNRGDIVVFERREGAAPRRDLIKRVVALEGETVEGRDDGVYVNGQRLDEPYVVDRRVTGPFGPERIPDGHVWVMGDNRANSRDSRSFAAIPESAIVGRAFVRIWPLTTVKLL